VHEGDAKEDATSEGVGNSQDFRALTTGGRADRPHSAYECLKERKNDEDNLGPKWRAKAVFVIIVAAKLLSSGCEKVKCLHNFSDRIIILID